MGIFNRKPISVEIVDTYADSRKKVGSTLIRGAVGGALLGGAGMLAGGLSGKNKIKNMTTFLIKYDDGTTETQTVKNNSFMYKTYMTMMNSLEQYGSGDVTITKKNGKVVVDNNESSIGDKYDQLKKLKELLDDGAITKEEFEKEKETLLK